MARLILSATFLLLAGQLHAAALDKAPVRSEAELVQACIQDMQKSLKPGQVMTQHQRMLAEQQCKAAAQGRK